MNESYQQHDRLSSPTNPNGVFADFADRRIQEEFPDPLDRLTIAVADIKSFLVEVVRIDPDMAEVVAARAAQEITAAITPDIEQKYIDRAIREGSALSGEVAVERALDDILGN